MRALLLAAGKATRLGDLSLTTPKCLHRVGNEVLLDRLVRQLSDVGVEEFLVNTHHLAPMIRDHILKRPDRSRFTIVYEPELLGTLGTLRSQVSFFNNEAGWVLHADNFIQGSLAGLRAGFESRPAQCLGAMLTFHTDEPKKCGVVLTSGKGIVTSVHEKVDNPPSNEASAATFIFDGRFLSRLNDVGQQMTDISRDLLPLLVNQMVSVIHEGQVVDIGTTSGLELARDLAAREFRDPEG